MTLAPPQDLPSGRGILRALVCPFDEAILPPHKDAGHRFTWEPPGADQPVLTFSLPTPPVEDLLEYRTEVGGAPLPAGLAHSPGGRDHLADAVVRGLDECGRARS